MERLVLVHGSVTNGAMTWGAVLPGAGHAVQRAPGFNETLADFLELAG